MKKMINFILVTLFVCPCLFLSGCLKSGMENLVNSSDKLLSTVDYSYRFLYNDTLQKGTANEEIMVGRVCDVLFYKTVEKTDQGGITVFKTTLTYDLNSILKAGPTGSVTKQMLFTRFEDLIKKDQLSNLWVYMTISDAATIFPKGDAPKLGEGGDFSKDQTYTVRAADGSTKDYLIQTVKGF